MSNQNEKNKYIRYCVASANHSDGSASEAGHRHGRAIDAPHNRDRANRSHYPGGPSRISADSFQSGRRRHSLPIKLAVVGLATALCGCLGVDLVFLGHVSVQFQHGAGLGSDSGGGARHFRHGGDDCARGEELPSHGLKNVEINQQKLAIQRENVHASDAHETIRDVIREIPRDRESTAAIEAFQRKVQRHHSSAQQIELLSETVVTPLDRRAEAIVRRASARAFGIVAISPTAVLDVLFFCCVQRSNGARDRRLLRPSADRVRHRPSVAATRGRSRKTRGCGPCGGYVQPTHRRRCCRTRGDERRQVRVCRATHGPPRPSNYGSVPPDPVSAERSPRYLAIINRQLARNAQARQR